MTRAFITLKNGSIINITADSFEMRDDWIIVWKGEFIVAFVKPEEVAFCYISETKTQN